MKKEIVKQYIQLALDNGFSNGIVEKYLSFDGIKGKNWEEDFFYLPIITNKEFIDFIYKKIIKGNIKKLIKLFNLNNIYPEEEIKKMLVTGELKKMFINKQAQCIYEGQLERFMEKILSLIKNQGNQKRR